MTRADEKLENGCNVAHVNVVRDSTDLYRVAFEYSTIGLALLFTSGQWYRVNRSLCEMLGYSEPELLLKRFQELVHPDERFATMTKVDSCSEIMFPFVKPS